MIQICILLTMIAVYSAEDNTVTPKIYYDQQNNLEVDLNQKGITRINVYVVNPQDEREIDFHFTYFGTFKPDVNIEYKKILPEMAFPKTDSIMFLNVSKNFKEGLRIKYQSCSKFDKSCSIPLVFEKIPPYDRRFAKYVSAYQNNGPLISIELFKIQETSNVFLNIQMDQNRFTEISGRKAKYFIPKTKEYQASNDKSSNSGLMEFVLNKEANYYLPNSDKFTDTLLFIMNHGVQEIYRFSYKYLGQIPHFHIDEIQDICHISVNTAEVYLKSNFKADLVAQIYAGNRMVASNPVKHLRRDVINNTVQHIYKIGATLYDVGLEQLKLTISHRLFPKVILFTMDLMTCSSSNVYLGENKDHIEFEKKIMNGATVFSIVGIKSARYVKINVFTSSMFKDTLVCELGKSCAIDSYFQCSYDYENVLCRLDPKASVAVVKLELGMHPDKMFAIPHSFNALEEFNLKNFKSDKSNNGILDNDRVRSNVPNMDATKVMTVSVTSSSRKISMDVRINCTVTDICEIYEITKSNQLVPCDIFEIGNTEQSLFFNNLVLKMEEKIDGNFRDNGVLVDVYEYHQLPRMNFIK